MACGRIFALGRPLSCVCVYTLNSRSGSAETASRRSLLDKKRAGGAALVYVALRPTIAGSAVGDTWQSPPQQYIASTTWTGRAVAVKALARAVAVKALASLRSSALLAFAGTAVQCMGRVPANRIYL